MPTDSASVVHHPAPLVWGVIPARYGSTRFPGKLLADLHGKPVLQWTWERARQARALSRLVIAAGDAKIAEAARGFGAEVVEVFEDLPSGSDRVWKAYQEMQNAECGMQNEDADIIVNIQGDEPMMDPGVIDAVVERLKSDSEAGVATAAAAITDNADITASSCVKVVVDEMGRAQSFSRAPRPYRQVAGGTDIPVCQPYKHIGLYAYRAAVLKRYTELPPSRLELAEKLEQLRLMEAGIKFAVAVVDYQGIAVDTEGDLERVRGMSV